MSLKLFFFLFSLLTSLYAASETENFESIRFFDFIESHASSSANTPLVNESFMDFLTAHVNCSFKNSELSPSYRYVLIMMQGNVEEYYEVLNLLKDGYNATTSLPDFRRWSVAFDHALNRLASSDPETLENIVNNHIIHSHPLKQYFNFRKFRTDQLKEFESVSDYLTDMGISIFRSEMFFLLDEAELTDVKFSQNQLKILNLIFKFSNSISWVDSSYVYHLTFIIRCIINAPLLSLTTLKRQFRSSTLPTFEAIAKGIYTELSSNSRDDLVKVLNNFAKDEIIDQLEYTELIEYIRNGTDLELVSPDYFMSLLNKAIVNPPLEIKGMDSCISIIKDHVVKIDESQLNETFFWVFYGHYANRIILEKMKYKNYWISAIYSLVAEVSKMEIAGETFSQLVIEMSEFYYGQGTLELLTHSLSYGHIPTARLLIAKLRTQITLETADNLLLVAVENNFNGVGEFLVSESGLFFSYRILRHAQSFADANQFEKLRALLGAKIELIEGASCDNLFEEETIADPLEEQPQVTVGNTETLLPNIATIAEQHASVIEPDSVLAAAITESCTNHDDEIILCLIESDGYETITSAEVEEAFMRLARAGRSDPILSIAASNWMSKISPRFRKNLMAAAIDQFPDDIFVLLISFNEFRPSGDDMEAIFVGSIPNRSLNVLNSMLEYWLPYIGFDAADQALSTAVTFDLLDKVNALVHSDLSITEKGAFNALTTAAEKQHFIIFEFLLSQSNPIEYSDDEIEIAMVLAGDNGYTPSKKRRI